MKTFKLSFFTALFLPFLIAWSAQAGVLSPELQSALQTARQQEEISVLFTLSERTPIHFQKDVNKGLGRSNLIKALREQADLTQRPLKVLLENRKAKEIKSLWLINGMAVKATPDVIRELESLPEIENIRLDGTIYVSAARYAASAVAEWNLTAIGAPELWSEGYKGAGVVVASLDTGVDLNHPDLQTRWRGGTNSWYDPSGEHTSPHDASGHGTRTMGIMVGGDAGGTAIGVAPGAKWIAVKIFNDSGESTYSTFHQGFQWLLDPDGNADTDDAPDVVNNSWGLDTVKGCSSEFETDVQILKAAGIAVVFAGGNSGPHSSTSISPANNPEGFAVGAVDQSLDIAYFSSRGPSACDGTVYPELIAPGVNIKTADLTYGGLFPDSYVVASGTSFAAPHVAGAMALLLSAFPTLTVSELELALKQSAFDLGAIGADNDYGYGLIDVMRAYDMLLNPAPKISISPSSHQFAKTKEGKSSSPQIFTLTNRGLQDLTVDTLSIAGSNATEFKTESDGCSGQTVAPLETCTVEVVFAPSSGGDKNAYVSIPSNDPYQDPALVALTGKGIERYNLQMVTEGTGTGQVKSTPAGIDCTADCSQLFTPGTTVTLEASPGTDSAFGSWEGCRWSSGRTCQVFMGKDRTVTVTFVGPSLTLTAPNGGETWNGGTYQKIKWTYTGKPGGYVRIELLDGESVKTIAEKVPKGENGFGRYSWLVPRSLAVGQAYKFRITSTRNGTYTDVSDHPFSIGP